MVTLNRIPTRLTCVVLLTCAVVCWAGRAWANEPTATLAPAESARPWAEGITDQQKERALELLKEGNQLLKDSSFKQAAAEYREALGVWDHPGIHYNLALALLNLEQVLDAHAHLQRALKYGPAPLETDKYEHAKRYVALLEKQLAFVEIRCEMPGAEVSLDGRHLFRAPGRYSGFERPGPHTVLASKTGLATTERTKVLAAGEKAAFHLELYAEGDLVGYRRRWPLWKPVGVTVGGVVLLGAGALFTYKSRNEFRDYDRAIQEQCQPRGCASDPAQATKDRGELYGTLATVSYVAGGIALAGGIVLVLLDPVLPYQKVPQRSAVALVAPLLAPDAAGLMVGGRF